MNIIGMWSKASLAAAGFSTTRIDERSFEITAAKGTLAKFVPISGRIAKDKHLENDILDLEEMTASSSPGQRLGFLIYDNLPDTLSRIKMADVRLRNDFFVIPLALRLLAKALVNPVECFGLIQEQTSRYLPGRISSMTRQLLQTRLLSLEGREY